MSADPPSTPLKHLWNTAQVAAVIVTLLGFTPDNWVAGLFRAANLEGLRTSLPAVDYRLLLVGLGVSIFTADIVLRNRRARKPAQAATPVITTAQVIDAIEDKPSIAVLPFVNMSDDKSQEYFADGITEDIITGLSFDSRLFVTARNSTFAYKGQSPDIRTVGKELGVRYVLEGSIRPIGDRLRITVQLIDSATGNHVWADKIDRPTAEIFDVMDEVVDGLVFTLCSNLGVAEAKRAARQRPEDLQAWALCVQAEVLYYSQLDTSNMLEAERLARRATEIEPGYAVSWALLASIESERVVWGLSTDFAKDSEMILSLVNKALRLAPNDPIVLGFCGCAALQAGQAAQAIDYLERSLLINSNGGFPLVIYGLALWGDARFDEGIDQLELFIRRSPKDPYLGLAYTSLALCYLSRNEPPLAELAARNSIKHGPGFAWGYFLLALSLEASGRDSEAKQQVLKARQLEPAMTRQNYEDLFRHVLQNLEQVKKFIALTRQAWPD